MSIKVGINGFGRIGRLVFRAGISRSDIEFVGINDPFMTPDYMAYMLRYDTMHGQFDGTIEYTDDAIIVNGKTVKFFACMDPKDIPWGKVGAEYVVESTGMFLALSDICGRRMTPEALAAGLRVDESGPLMAADTRAKLPLCHEQGFMIPDDPQTLRPLVMELALGQGYDLILTSGGTGLAPRDTTPEALLPIFERRLPGFEQAMMQASLAKTPTAAISRAVAGTLGRTIVITLPGSRKAVSENLAAILPALGHALEKLHGDPSDCGKRA